MSDSPFGELARGVNRLLRLVPKLVAMPHRRLSEFAELAGLLAEGLHPPTSDEKAFQIAERLASATYPAYKFSEFGRTWLDDADFRLYYERFMGPGNWHSLDRKYVLAQLLKLCDTVAGDTAECGAYKGATSYLVCAHSAANNSGLERHHHIFDSFAGLSEPQSTDGDYWTAGDLAATEADIRHALSEFDGYTTYPGWIPERFTEVAEQRFAFIHVDVDLYQPTRDSIEFFYPRLNTGGILLMDDYGFRSCPGATWAADEFLADKPEPIVHLPTGQGLVVKAAKES